MAKAKDVAEAPARVASAPTVEQQVKPPEKSGDPVMLSRAAANFMPRQDGARARLVNSIQRSLGNAYLERTLGQNGHGATATLPPAAPGGRSFAQEHGSFVQTRLLVNGPGDLHEQEAEQVANAFTTKTNPESLETSQAAPRNRMPPVQRSTPANGNAGATEVHDPALRTRIEAPGAGRPLSPGLRQEMETGLGTDFSSVRVHDSRQDQADADHLGARAFTHGRDVWIGSAGSAEDRNLMAHEMTHVVQQGGASGGLINRQSGPKKDEKKTTPAASVSGLKGSVPAAGDVAPGIVELKGNPNFQLAPAAAGFIDGHKQAVVNVRFGKFAQGPIKVRSQGDGQYQVDRQPIPLTHPLFRNLGALPAGLQPTLIIAVRSNKLSGEVGLGEHGFSEKLQKMDQASTALGLAGFDLGRLPKITNTIEGGSLHLGMAGIPFTLGGVFQGRFNLDVIDEKIGFEGNANVNVKGLATGALELKRSPEGLVTGKANIALQLAKNSKSYSGSVDVVWDGESITGAGKVGYQGEKLSGEVILNLMDRREAEKLKAEKQAPPAGAGAAKRETPAKPGRKEPVSYVVFGEGDLTFSFTDWLNGTAHVIVDHQGYLTITGKITPQKEYTFLDQKDYVKQLFKVEARASYGIPVVGNIFIFANASMDAFAKLGPGKLYNIVVEGKYSTDPQESRNFSIQASLNISAAAGMRLRGEAGAGLEILAHDIKAGAGINGIAGIRGYADATPVIGYREKAKDGEDRKGEFFIRGDLEIAAQPFLGLSGDLFVEIDAPWWSPVPDKKWTWPLFNKEWPLGGSLGMLASVDYVLGSKEFPKVDFKPAEFSADKFFTDLYQDKAQPKSKEAGEQKGDWKEKNSKEAEPSKGGGKGEVAAGKAPAELPSAKPKVQPGGPKKPEKPVDPNARTVEGKSVKELQEEAARKGKKPEGKDVAKGVEGEKTGEKGQEKPAEAKTESQKWERGVAVVKQALAYAEREGIDLQELNQILKSIKKRKEYGFTELVARDEEDVWLIVGSMSPDGKPVTKAKKKTKLSSSERKKLDKIRQSFTDVRETSPGKWWVGPYETLVRFRGKLQVASPDMYIDYLYEYPPDRKPPESHHIVEKRHVKLISDVDENTMPSVLIPSSLHRKFFTPALLERLPTSQGPYSVDDIGEVYLEVYSSVPDLKTIAVNYLKTLKKFGKKSKT